MTDETILPGDGRWGDERLTTAPAEELMELCEQLQVRAFRYRQKRQHDEWRRVRAEVIRRMSPSVAAPDASERGRLIELPAGEVNPFTDAPRVGDAILAAGFRAPRDGAHPDAVAHGWDLLAARDAAETPRNPKPTRP